MRLVRRGRLVDLSLPVLTPDSFCYQELTVRLGSSPLAQRVEQGPLPAGDVDGPSDLGFDALGSKRFVSQKWGDGEEGFIEED